MLLGSKAATLHALRGRIKSARILPMFSFTVAQLEDDRRGTLAEATGTFGRSTPLIVRSSCSREDNAQASSAGAFLSVPNVKGDTALEEAVDAVAASYRPPQRSDQILVQPYLERVKLAGVALTREPNTGAHYFIINYDESGGTSGITSGTGTQQKTHVSSKSSPLAFESPIHEILGICKELEEVLAYDSLDIEFAIDQEDALYLFQVRPLVLPPEATASLESQSGVIANIERTVVQGMRRHPYLQGDRTVYGIMPDWNPAEIIGIRPRPLALSLYRDLVTDSIWSYQRNNYGYKNLRSFPLMVDFSGLPYIDVRVSLNSFIPKDTDDSFGERLATYYLDRLLAAPSLHDKIEFEVVFSCYTVDLPQRLEPLRAHGFSGVELQSLAASLRRLTNKIIGAGALWRGDRNKLAILEEHQGLIMSAGMGPAQKIYWLLEDCKRYGTLPFAGLARAAFIAMQMLRSLVSVGVLSEREYDTFLGSLYTISSEITADFATESRDEFLKKYGHLRPGTYDILSPRYDRAPDLYFNWQKVPHSLPRQRGFAPSSKQLRAVTALLEAHQLECDAHGLFEFIRNSIEWREKAKFLFTRSLSDALSSFEEFGAEMGFSVEELSFANIGVISELNSSSSCAGDLLTASISAGYRSYRQALELMLPPLITSARDVWGFFVPPSEPNFVTRKSITARCVNHAGKESLTGSIVLIESADPGFDWIFSHCIGGLVTAYGGANSHMAIRAAELGLPAVIGAGDMLFRRWSAARFLRIDCANRTVNVVQCI